ncbi:hypothetical protein FSP39_000027 [Pinctada imbricata]|uniref:Transmembrane protein 5 n=1 Tax=Pinctada imbricata TaxID=66713 RepID=A0AA88Y8Z3_PINIB|nr:hypothetical protein FSP39_000027 [Pinctada imbricata]
MVLLGDEQCNNDWIKPYLRRNGGLIQFVFLVYDSTEIDNEVFYQWPLGVATWLPMETDASREEYIKALSESDLTLNPVGQNTECYRIYEAMSYGSVPVIEDVMTSGHCGNSSISQKSPLRLLKEEKAPVIYVKDWKEIDRILEKETTLTQEYKTRRRRDNVLWYESFKSKMRERFVRILQKHFFPVHR